MLASSFPALCSDYFAFTFTKLLNICSIITLSRVHESAVHSLSRFPRQSSISFFFCCYFSSASRFSFEHNFRTRVTRTPAQRENVLSKDVVLHISIVDDEKSDDGEKFSVSMLVRCLEPLSAAIKKNFSRTAPSLNACSSLRPTLISRIAL